MSVKKEESRVGNMIANSAVGIIATIIQVILNYAVRIVIVRALGAEINGLHNLFQSIINVLLLLESGFGTAMVVHLYKPIADGDKKLILSIVQFYKKIYFAIALAFLCFGIIVDAFIINHIVNTTIPMFEIRLYFMIFVFSFVVNYMTYYKRSIIFAEQKNRISILASLISEVVFRGLQIIVALHFHNYYLFLVMFIFEKVSSNMICNHYIDKLHPYIKHAPAEIIRPELKDSVFSMVRPLLVYNISSTVQQSSKSVLISSLLGNIKVVGYFGNYQLVTSSALLLFSQFGGAFTTAFGNLSVGHDEGEMFRFYRKACFWMNWLAIFVAAGIISCIKDFILFAFGEEYVLSFICTVVLVVDMLVYLFSIPVISVQNALGLHSLDKNYMIIQTFVAICFGYIGGRFWGMLGIFIGLLIPQVVFTFIHKGIIIYRHVFGKCGLDYMKSLCNELVKATFVIFVNAFICNYVRFDNILLNFFLKILVVIVITVLLCCVLSMHNDFFREGVLIIKNRLHKRG